MVDHVANPGQDTKSPAQTIGHLLRDQLASDPSFRFFSPDETTSNKLDSVFTATDRAWLRPLVPWDKYLSKSGRIIELLSETTLASLLIGHNLAGHPGALASYEAFLPIITSQLDQYLKFLKQSIEIPWRPSYPALNLLSTSTCWRQDHNGYSHQNPSLISHLLAKPSNLANCLFPIDAVAAETALHFAFSSQNVVNLTTFNKTPEPIWIDSHHAQFQFDNGGASLFAFASDDHPDIIITAAGDIPSKEALKAISLIKKDLPSLRLRFVGITALSYQAIGTTQNKLSQQTFDALFTTDKPIIANFHGYPPTLAQIFSTYTPLSRLKVHGYEEQGSTTTPLDMLIRNHASRYDLAISIANQVNRPDLAANYHQKIHANTAYIKLHGIDLPDPLSSPTN